MFKIPENIATIYYKIRLMIVFHYSTIYLLTYRTGLYLHVDGIFVALAPV